jgi:hypothetical protein
MDPGNGTRAGKPPRDPSISVDEHRQQTPVFPDEGEDRRLMSAVKEGRPACAKCLVLAIIGYAGATGKSGLQRTLRDLKAREHAVVVLVHEAIGEAAADLMDGSNDSNGSECDPDACRRAVESCGLFKRLSDHHWTPFPAPSNIRPPYGVRQTFSRLEEFAHEMRMKRGAVDKAFAFRTSRRRRLCITSKEVEG